jgi:hypothetical protein
MVHKKHLAPRQHHPILNPATKTTYATMGSEPTTASRILWVMRASDGSVHTQLVK